MFYGLTRPDTYMDNIDDPIEMIGAIMKYQELMSKLNDNFFSSYSFLQTCCTTLYDRFFKNPRSSDLNVHQHLSVIYLLQGIYDLYMVNYSACTKIRKFLIEKTDILETILVPYIINCVEFAPALATGSVFLEDPLILQGVVVALKLLCTISFRIEGDKRLGLILTNFTSHLLKLIGFFKKHPGVLALLLLYNSNLDSLHPGRQCKLSEEVMPNTLLRGFGEIFSQMKVSDVLTVLALLERSGELNIARDTITYTLLWKLIQGFIEDLSCDEVLLLTNGDNLSDDDDESSMSSSMNASRGEESIYIYFIIIIIFYENRKS